MTNISFTSWPFGHISRILQVTTLFPDWASVATISSRPEIFGFPFANVFSVSDGATLQTSSGVPYMYLSKMEMSVKDLKVSCMWGKGKMTTLNTPYRGLN
jgi:hypothetical protein